MKLKVNEGEIIVNDIDMLLKLKHIFIVNDKNNFGLLNEIMIYER
jgi:hypothetical protein